MIEEMIANMAVRSMKDNFLSLSDEQKQNEFCKLLDENQELKRQLEEINKMIEKCGFVNIEQVMLNYCGLLSQQKEFISYLENEIEKKRKKTTTLTSFIRNVVPLKHCLQKYKSIIGVLDENKANI